MLFFRQIRIPKHSEFTENCFFPSLRMRNSGHSCASGLLSILLKYIFFYSWTCLQDCCGADRHQKSPLDSARDFLLKIWQHITTVHFVSAFIFVLRRKPENTSKHIWIGPKHNYGYYKSLWGCLLIKSWSSYQHIYAGKYVMVTHSCWFISVVDSNESCPFQLNQSKYENYENEGAIGGHDVFLA